MKHFTRSRPKLRSGFTLIELLVVVTIIVVLLALLVPMMDLLRSPGVYAWESVSPPNPFPVPFRGLASVALALA